ncbi:MAG TPA: hypothetical protein VMB80_03765 [Candidatus Acidoferrum sp.]|nr:hypothetical protein [Candidatus Acidoferrum sp.]
METRASQVLIVTAAALISVSVFGSLWLAGWSYWQIYHMGGWRDEVYELVGVTASTQAMDDYQEGHLRLYTLGGESEKPKYTGTNDGPFEVWIPQFYPSLGHAHRYATEQFIEFYNRKMHYMNAHPDKFMRKSETVPQDGAANGGQPLRSETNTTSSVAGSRR